MFAFFSQVLAVFRSPPQDASAPSSQTNSYREVISLQAIFVTLIIALVAYIQKSPEFQARVDAMFLLLAAVPIVGLYHIVRGRTRTPECDVYVCTRPIRDYARQAFILDLVIVVLISYLYWQGQLPGQ